MANSDERSLEETLKREVNTKIVESAQQDRDWWLNPELRFPTDEERDSAIESGRLVHVEANDLFRFSTEVRVNEKLQYLRPEAAELLDVVMKELDRSTKFSSKNIRLIVSSLHRTDSLQQEIVNSEDWYFAAPVGTSSHAAGAAFDINIRTHYLEDEPGKYVGTWVEGYADRYDVSVMDEVGEVLIELCAQGLCNVIVEERVLEGDLVYAVYHVCVAPNADESFLTQRES